MNMYNNLDVRSLKLDDYVVHSTVSITYESLSVAISNRQLVSGQRYCILDYDSSLSVLVVANSISSIDECAYAMSNDGKHFDIKYCASNDSSRFGWAAADGKGVIYWMKDEHGNEVPYDFHKYQTFFGNAAGNVITPCIDSSMVHQLNNIEVHGNAFGNIFGFGCANVKLSGDFGFNIFESGCCNLSCTTNGSEMCQYITVKGGDYGKACIVEVGQTYATTYQPFSAYIKSI